MRFLRAALAAAACFLATTVWASAESVRAEISGRLQRQLPDLRATDYTLGSSAFDPGLRSQAEQASGAAATTLEAGRKLWNAKFRDGKALSNCFPNAGRRVAALYPQYDARLKRVVTLEMAINQCRKTHGEAPYEPADSATMGLAIGYLRSLSNGQKVSVRVPAAADASFEQGRRLYFTRLGQRNFACASCHLQAAGKFYGDAALSPAIGQAAHWPVVRDTVPVTLQARIRECLELMGAAPFPAGSEELNTLEYFLTYLSNGLPLMANVWRPKP